MHPELEALLHQQLGVITHLQALAFFSPEAIRHRVRAGRWERILHGIYAIAGGISDPLIRAAAAQLAYGDRVFLSFEDAATLLGFGVLSSRTTHVTALAGDDIQGCAGVTVHTSTVAIEPVVVRGLRGTPAARTVVDLARSRTLRNGLAVADAALARGLERDDLVAEVARHAGLRGVVNARQVVAWADARSESPQESRVRAECLRAGFPPPDLQISICDAWGNEIYRIDLGWKEYKLGVEYDGQQFHLFDQAVFRRDRQKQNHLLSMGWELLRFTDVDLHPSTQAMTATIGSALVRRGWRPRASAAA